jgi:hypothetical protein
MLLAWRVESNLPVIGCKVERLFADLIRTSLDADHAFTLHYLETEPQAAVGQSKTGGV